MHAILCLRTRLSAESIRAWILTHRNRVVSQMIVCAAFALIPSVQVFAQGFAGRASEIRITRRLPPRVYIGGTTFSVEVNSSQQISPQLLILARAKIAEAISVNSRGLAAVESGADASIRCSIQSLHSSSRNATWTTNEYQKTGQHTVHDDTTGMDQTVDDYGYVSVSHYGILIEGDISAWYEITDTASGAVLDNAQLGPTYSQTFEGGGKMFDPFADLAGALANQIATRLTPDRQTVILALPKGQIKAANRLFAVGLWDRALDALTKMPPLKRPEDDAYRFYMIGVVKEWLGYYAIDPGVAKDLIDQSIVAYAAARSMKPREPVFADAAGRAAAAAREYSAFLDQARALQALQSKATPDRSLRPRQQQGQPADATLPGPTSAAIQPISVSSTYYGLTNDAIVGWLRLALPDREIVARIKASRQSLFDLSPSALYELRQTGATEPIIQAMLKQQAGLHRVGAARLILALAMGVMTYLPLILR